MYNSLSSVLVYIRTFLSLLHTYVVDLPQLNFSLPFNIPVILTYTNISRVNAFGRLLSVYLYIAIYRVAFSPFMGV